MSILPPALFPHSYPHNCYSFLSHFYPDSHIWALNQLSVLFLAVSSCFYPQKAETVHTLCPSIMFPPPPQLLVLSDSFYLCSHLWTSDQLSVLSLVVSGCQNPLKKRKLCHCCVSLRAHSVKICVRYVDNMMILYCLRHPSGHLVDYT